MIDIGSHLLVILPELIIAIMAMVVLLVDLYIKDSDRSFIYSLTQLSLLAAGIVTAGFGFQESRLAFNDMFVSDSLSLYLKSLSYVSLSIALIYSRNYLKQKKLWTGEFLSLTLFSLLGIMLMISSHHLLVIYMGLELLSLCLYSLVALHRDNLKASEAAIKYFILGALASGLLLYGMSMLYGFSGSLDISVIASSIAQNNIEPSLLIFGLVFIVVGIAFKLGAVPFHMWVPDVYQGAPLPVTMLISSVPKFAAVGMAVRLLYIGLDDISSDWQQMLLIMALLSMAIGNITAIAQTNIKRMLAYSTISHVGFILLGFMSGSINGVGSVLFYVACYVLMTLAAFGLLIAISTKDSDIELIDDLKGLNSRNSWAAGVLMITMLSMAGIPPTVGFYAKFSVLQSALNEGFVWSVVFSVLMALIGIYYYLRIIKIMYFDAPIKKTKIKVPGDMFFILSLNAGALAILGISPKILMSFATLSSFITLQ